MTYLRERASSFSPRAVSASRCSSSHCAAGATVLTAWSSAPCTRVVALFSIMMSFPCCRLLSVALEAEHEQDAERDDGHARDDRDVHGLPLFQLHCDRAELRPVRVARVGEPAVDQLERACRDQQDADDFGDDHGGVLISPAGCRTLRCTRG